MKRIKKEKCELLCDSWFWQNAFILHWPDYNHDFLEEVKSIDGHLQIFLS